MTRPWMSIPPCRQHVLLSLFLLLVLREFCYLRAEHTVCIPPTNLWLPDDDDDLDTSKQCLHASYSFAALLEWNASPTHLPPSFKEQASPECLLFQMYHHESHHGKINRREQRVRGLRLAGTAPLHYPDDLFAQDLLPLLRDPYYQNILCEFGGMLALEAHLDKVHTAPWIGFTTHKDDKKRSWKQRIDWSEINLRAQADDLFLFWHSGFPSVNTTNNLYGYFEAVHPGAQAMFEEVFHFLFNASVPPMPTHSPWSYASYWIMSRSSFRQWCKVLKIFIATLDRLYGRMTRNTEACPLGVRPPATDTQEYVSQHCYCFFLERLVNVWIYHSGRRFIEADVVSIRHNGGRKAEKRKVLRELHTDRVSLDFNLSDPRINALYEAMARADVLLVK